MILHATIDLVDDLSPIAADTGSEAPRSPGTRAIKYLVCLGHSPKHFLISKLGLLRPLSISHNGTGLVRVLHAHQACHQEADPVDL